MTRMLRLPPRMVDKLHQDLERLEPEPERNLNLAQEQRGCL